MTERSAPARRKKRDRARTEADLLDAAQRLFDRDGVLAGLNLNEVATEAHVNRGQIYQMYGSRRALLRAALSRGLTRFRGQRPDHWDADFSARKRAMMRFAISEGDVARFGTLLALDGDEDFHIFPSFDMMRAALERDIANGALPADADAEALHTLTTAACLGYALMREAAARDMSMPVDELDTRVMAVYDRIIEDMTQKPQADD